MSKYYMGGENQTTIQKLLAGETVIIKGKGNSMTPKLKSGEAVIVEPITPDTIIRKRDIVLCKVKGHIYLHLVTGVSGDSYKISNNHGHDNGWTKQVYGKYVRKATADELKYRFDHCRDDILFSYYLRGSANGLLTGEEIKKLLNKGHELPINWHNFYAYFDKRANDEECGYRESILNPDYTSLDDDGWKHLSIMDILNRYRDILLKPDYDIV